MEPKAKGNTNVGVVDATGKISGCFNAAFATSVAGDTKRYSGKTPKLVRSADKNDDAIFDSLEIWEYHQLLEMMALLLVDHWLYQRCSLMPLTVCCRNL